MIKKPKVAALLCSALLFTVVLSGCQSTPDSVALNPQLDASATGNSVQLRVRDQRAHNHVMRVKTDEDSAEFATADPSLASLISNRLGERWTISDAADAQLEVFIHDALVVIHQGSLRHDTEHSVRVQAQLTTPSIEFEKVFSGNRETNGPLRADRNRVGREFSELLGSVLSDIANDETLNRHIEEAQ